MINRTPSGSEDTRPIIKLGTPTPDPESTEKINKFKKNYSNYYFVIEESLRVLEYNAENYNRAVCSGDRGEANRIRQKLNVAVLDADVLMDKLNLYNNLYLWNIWYTYIQTPECGLDHGLIAETKGAMDRLHRQTEELGLWVPSTGESKLRMDKANCPQGWFTAPNGVCLSENGPAQTRYYHSNGYVVECVWPGYCDKINFKGMNRCDWMDCE
ncbi:MAG: hypothetical protein IJI14_08185 [Anaerolineaceae bacterium]|nr:hypothetical protein [Anaerolineaceae bacterium]